MHTTIHCYGRAAYRIDAVGRWAYSCLICSCVVASVDYSLVCYCSAVSKNRFDLDNTIGQTFAHASDANGRVKVNGRNSLRNFNFNTI